MKSTIKILFIVGIFLLSACSEWLNVNEDPNNPDKVDYSLVLPSGTSSICYVVGGRYQVLGALWSQQWTQSPGASQYAGIDAYDINSSTFDDAQFGALYSGALKALEYVKLEAEKEKEWNYYLIATVLQAYTYQVLADLYDEIPFSDALKGDELVLAPHFDKGQVVYDSLIIRIDKALSKDLTNKNLKKPDGTNDLIFSGNMQNWIKFANTLKLKIYLRQSEVRSEIAKNGIVKMFNNEVDFLDVDAAMTAFQDQSGRRNPLYETEINALGGNPNLILSRAFHSYLIEKGDFKRLDYLFYNPSDGGAHKSLIQGNYNDPDEPSGTNSSSYSKPIFQAANPVYLMSLSEADFLQSEAIVRYLPAKYTDGKEKYDEAIRLSYYRILGGYLTDEVIAEEADGFINDVYRFPSEGSPQESFIESIIVQKWIALSGIQNLETFFEQNRTHYPSISPVAADNDDYVPGELTLSVNNVTSGRFPKRLIFPASEITGNPNTPDQKPVYEKIWWDKKAE